MPTIMTHAAVGIALGSLFPREALPRRIWLVGAVCAVAPDLDVFAFALDIPYEAPFGHRGFFHGMFFAVALGLLLAEMLRRSDDWTGAWRAAALYLCLAGLSHGLLDALTNGGLGIALLAPFSSERYFAPWQPIQVSPIGLNSFLSAMGMKALLSEMFWVWIPCAALAAAGVVWRRRYQVPQET